MTAATPSPQLRIEVLEAERLPDWLDFFDGAAFRDNPEWGSCYCRAFLFEGDGDGWEAACAANSNRSPMMERIRAGRTSGLLAYRGEELIGWCHVGPRCDFRFAYFEALPPDDAARETASVVCFVVHPEQRRQGVARALLDAAVEYSRGAGFTGIEGYPTRAEQLEPGEAHLFSGPLALYLAAGFQQIGSVRNRHILRKTL